MFGAALAAQGPRGSFAWWDSPVVRDLNLRDDQQQQVRAAVKEFRNHLVDLRGAVEKAEGELEDAFNEEKFDQRKAGEASERLASARAELTKSLSNLNIKLRSILTSEQWRELQKRRPMGPPGGRSRGFSEKGRPPFSHGTPPKAPEQD
jgi:Spy/CpxP family protein refolding chaperone